MLCLANQSVLRRCAWMSNVVGKQQVSGELSEFDAELVEGLGE